MTPTEANTLAEYGEDALAEIAEDMEAEGHKMIAMAFTARQELLRRLTERKATVLNTEHWAGQLRPGTLSHTVDDPQRLYARLQDYVDDKILKAVISTRTVKQVEQRQLNNLLKLGGDVARIIAEEQATIRGDPKLELKRKKDVPLEVEAHD